MELENDWALTPPIVSKAPNIMEWAYFCFCEC